MLSATKEVTCPTCNSKLEVKSRFAHLELSKHNVKVHKTTPAKTPAKRAVAKKATPRRRAQHKPTLAPQG
jgi:DNA-directed RNA polymerase subunit RPC12/RpoP